MEKKRQRKLEWHHTIWIASWWMDIAENIINIAHWIHLNIHKTLYYPNCDQIRELRWVENYDVIPSKKVFELREKLWKQTFWNIEKLDDETIILTLQSLGKVRNFEIQRNGKEKEEIDISWNPKRVAYNFCEEIIDLKKERLNLILWKI